MCISCSCSLKTVYAYRHDVHKRYILNYKSIDLSTCYIVHSCVYNTIIMTYQIAKIIAYETLPPISLFGQIKSSALFI